MCLGGAKGALCPEGAATCLALCQTAHTWCLSAGGIESRNTDIRNCIFQQMKSLSLYLPLPQSDCECIDLAVTSNRWDAVGSGTGQWAVTGPKSDVTKLTASTTTGGPPPIPLASHIFASASELC